MKPFLSIYTNVNISWYEYHKNKIDLKKYKVIQLKNIARAHNLFVYGNKSILINRIEIFFKKLNYITKIQAWIRRFLVGLSFKLRGPAFIDRNICVNNCDFYSLDPLNEIPFEDFFSYSDVKGFVYGFNIESLIYLFKKTGTITNPYNRDQMDYDVVRNIIQLFKISHQIFKVNNQVKTINNNTNNANTQNIFINTISIDENYSLNFTRDRVVHKLNEMRQKSENVRIQEVFIEIDQMGNYTDSEWFSQLNNNNLFSFIQHLYDIWSYRSNMSFVVRSQICPYFNPFLFATNTGLEFNENIKHNCIAILENIVFSGGETEYRKLGIIHILTALTLVSRDARASLPWLYESASF
jgi:hypothetical protein